MNMVRDLDEVSGGYIALSRGLMCIMPIAQIAIGAVYLHDCPQQPHIPIYLVVIGVVSLLVGLLPGVPKKVSIAWNVLVVLFISCWFIAGNVWIYSIYPANYNETQTDIPYCNKTLYLFAFWITTLGYAFCYCSYSVVSFAVAVWAAWVISKL